MGKVNWDETELLIASVRDRERRRIRRAQKYALPVAREYMVCFAIQGLESGCTVGRHELGCPARLAQMLDAATRIPKKARAR